MHTAVSVRQEERGSQNASPRHRHLLPEDIHTGWDVWTEMAAISCFSRVLAQHSEEGVQPRLPLLILWSPIPLPRLGKHE